MSQCISCRKRIKPWFRECYHCHSQHRGSSNLILGIISFIWLPSIPTLLLVGFGNAFRQAGMPNNLLLIFWAVSSIILILVREQELHDIYEQIMKLF